MGRFAIALLLALPTEIGKPSLVVRVSPPMALSDLGLGCAPFLLTAEIRGAETEEWYCPRVEWTWPNGTTSATESDCPPFDARHACMEPQKECGIVSWHREPDGRIVDTVKECPCTIVGYPRRWMRRICLPPNDANIPWEIVVRLSRDGKTFARGSVQAHVR